MNYCLHMSDAQLQLLDQDEPDVAPVCIDFLSGKTAYRRKYGHAGGEAISKAVGIKKGHRPNVVDATAGLGTDAFVLANMGCRVQMIERSDVIAKLLEDGLRRAEQDQKIGTMIKEKLSLTCGDSRQELLRVPFDPEVILSRTPCFPLKEKSALVKKKKCECYKMSWGRILTLMSYCTSRSRLQRIVWSSSARPNANFLAEITPHTSIKTKRTPL